MPVCYFMDSFACGFETRSRVEGKASKTVHVCYSMGLSACGCETRAVPSNSLATTALFTSWNNANALNVFSAFSSTFNEILQTLTTFCLCLLRRYTFFRLCRLRSQIVTSKLIVFITFFITNFLPHTPATHPSNIPHNLSAPLRAG